MKKLLFFILMGLISLNAAYIKGNIIFSEDMMFFKQFKLSEVSGIKYKIINNNTMDVTLLIDGAFVYIGKLNKKDFLKLEKELNKK